MSHPSKLGKYAIDGVLGSGAMGVVYQATDPVIMRRVALKTIQRSLMDGDMSGSSIAARFRNEAQAAGRLTHPGIVSIYEYGEEGDTAFIAMEFVEGQDLAKVLTANAIMSEPMLLQIMDQLLSALHYAHERGVWHRDIKPANLILTQLGQLKITDFGIARIRDAAITQVTSTIGTHGYMSPEQYRGQAIDQRVDVFAAGVLLYRLLAAQPAFSGAPETIMYKVLNEDPPAPSTVSRVQRTIQVDSVVAKALAKDPRERYPTAGAFREALRTHASKTSQGHALIAAALNGDETVLDPQAAQFLNTHVQALSTGSNWDADLLSSVERALASFVGPLAKMLVKQAAAKSLDYDALVGAVAQHLQTQDERTRFMAKVSKSGTAGSVNQRGTGGAAVTGSSSTSGSSSGATGGATTTGAGAHVITAELVAHATKVLATHMGPMARVIVKQAQGRAGSAAQFIDLLVQHSADGVDRQRLAKELQQGLGVQGKS